MAEQEARNYRDQFNGWKQFCNNDLVVETCFIIYFIIIFKLKFNYRLRQQLQYLF